MFTPHAARRTDPHRLHRDHRLVMDAAIAEPPETPGRFSTERSVRWPQRRSGRAGQPPPGIARCCGCRCVAAGMGGKSNGLRAAQRPGWPSLGLAAELGLRGWGPGSGAGREQGPEGVCVCAGHRRGLLSHQDCRSVRIYAFDQCHRQDSNLRSRLRRPLSHDGELVPLTRLDRSTVSGGHHHHSGHVPDHGQALRLTAAHNVHLVVVGFMGIAAADLQRAEGAELRMADLSFRRSCPRGAGPLLCRRPQHPLAAGPYCGGQPAAIGIRHGSGIARRVGRHQSQPPQLKIFLGG